MTSPAPAEALVIFGTPGTEPALRHEVPISIWDPCLFIELDEKRVLVSSFEAHLIEAVDPELEVLPLEAFGGEELANEGVGREQIDLIVAERACKRLGVTAARVPPTFPLEVADHLRAAGVEVRADRSTFASRRRSKTNLELESIRRALRAGENAMAVAASMLAAAANGDDIAPPTSEAIKAAIIEEVARHGATADDIVVSHGTQTAVGHDLGSGVIEPGQPVIIDFCPRDGEAKCFADISRTFVIGSPPEELVQFHDACKEALELTTSAIAPGVDGRRLHEAVCEAFRRRGYATDFRILPTAEPGFYHGLGHGIGLDVIEPPWLRRESWTLVEGDVMAIEPGIYQLGFGGCRIEELVHVTADGAELLTDFPRDLSPHAGAARHE